MGRISAVFAWAALSSALGCAGADERGARLGDAPHADVVGSLSKQVDDAKLPEDALRTACHAWRLTAADVTTFFARASVVTGEEHHAEYDVFECWYSGYVIIDGEQYTFRLNAGQFAYLSGPAEAIYGCKQPCAALFPGVFEEGDGDD